MAQTKYAALAETLRNDILSGKYLCDSPLPSLRGLMRRHSLSDRTVRQALDALAHEGLIERRQGSGTFVSVKGLARKIGFIVPGTAYSEFFSRIVCEVLSLAQKAGKELLFGEIVTKDPKARAREAKKMALQFVEQGVSGVIYQPVEFVRNSEACNREIMALFEKAHVPVVLLDCDIVKSPKRSTFDLVSINNESAGGQLAELLIAKGARNIHFLLHPDHSPNMYKRMNGVMTTVIAHGLDWSPDHVMDIPTDDAKALVRHVRQYRPDAIVCGTDLVAAYLNRALAEAGIRVPDDLFLVGFDDQRTAEIMSPTLTTIRQPCELLANRAFSRLLERMVDPTLAPMEFLLPTSLIERKSTAESNRKGCVQ